MRYKNIKTGVVIETTSNLTGEAWKPASEFKKKKKEETPKEEYIEEEINLEEMTNKELDKFAKEHDIHLTTEDKKSKKTRINAIVKAFE